MNVLLSMSLGGTLIVLAYMLVKAREKENMTLRIQWGFSLTASLFFLFPYPKLKYRYLGLLERLPVRRLADWLNDLLENRNRWFYEVKNQVGETVFFKDERVLITAGILLVGFSVFFLREWKGAGKYRKALLKEKKTEEKRQVGIHRVSIIQSANADIPVASGIFHPKVIVPDGALREEEKKMAIEHEIQHIKSGDMFLNVLKVVLISLHWFNPFIYYLVRELGHLQELRCDELVVRNMDARERECYASLLLRLAKVETEKRPFASLLSGSGKKIEERMRRIMMKKESRKGKKIMGVVVLVCSIFLSSLTVFAYAPVHTYTYDDSVMTVEEAVDFYLEGEFVPGEDLEILEIEKWVCAGKDVFVGEDGSVYYFDENRVSVAAESCSHNYIKGTYKRHIKQGSGCIIEILDGEMCSKCKDLKTTKILSSTTYTTCSH